MKIQPFKSLFLDVGGVLLTNGWDRHMREEASKLFDLDYEEMNKRHGLLFDAFEIGKLSLDDYIKWMVFYEPRSFSIEEFKQFMFEQSKPYDLMLELVRQVKREKGMQVVLVSNEGRELMYNRIEKFKMKEFVDIFVVSSFVGLRKPDKEIYYLAFDLAQVKPEQVIYIDDRPLLAEFGQHLGMKAIEHRSYEQTKAMLESLLTLRQI